MSEETQAQNFIATTEDKQHAVVKLDLQFDAAGVDDLIARLVDLRAQLEPEHPEEPPLRKFRPLLWTRWHCAAELMNGDTAIMFRNPGLGWLAFLLDGTTREKLAEELTKQSQRRPETGKMN